MWKMRTFLLIALCLAIITLGIKGTLKNFGILIQKITAMDIDTKFSDVSESNRSLPSIEKNFLEIIRYRFFDAKILQSIPKLTCCKLLLSQRLYFRFYKRSKFTIYKGLDRLG